MEVRIAPDANPLILKHFDLTKLKQELKDVLSLKTKNKSEIYADVSKNKSGTLDISAFADGEREWTQEVAPVGIFARLKEIKTTLDAKIAKRDSDKAAEDFLKQTCPERSDMSDQFANMKFDRD